MAGYTPRDRAIGRAKFLALSPEEQDERKKMLHAAPVVKSSRQQQALDLRAQGFTYNEIGEQMEISGSAAKQLVQNGLDASLQEPADEVRRLEDLRLERMLRGIWPRAILGDYDAIDRVLKIMERKAKMLGLDQPMELDIRQVRLELLGFLRETLEPEVYQRVLTAMAD